MCRNGFYFAVGIKRLRNGGASLGLDGNHLRHAFNNAQFVKSGKSFPQAEGSAAIAEAFNTHSEVKSVSAHTVADSIVVNYPRDAALALQALQESDGMALTVTDEEILQAIPELARKANIFAEPAGAATYAALKKLAAQGKIERDETVVLVVGGNGLKDIDSAMQVLPKVCVIPPTMAAVEQELKAKGFIK